MIAPVLVLHDGRRVELDDDVVVGRAPVAPESAPGARSVSVSVQTVSKTHALIGADASGVWVVDLGSSNGTEILGASGRGERIASGVRVRVPPGSVLRVGTDTVIDIDRGGPDLDQTIVRPAGAPGVVPAQPGTQGRPLAQRADDVDWSAEPAPPPGRPTPAIDSSAPEPASAPPPPPAPPPPVAPGERPPAAPTTIDIASAPPAPAAPAPSHAPPPPFASAPSFVAPPAATVDPGLSTINVIGLVVLAFWGLVTTLRIAEIWVPDSVNFGDSVPLRFFDAFTTDDVRFLELYGVAELPDVLAFTAYVVTVGTLLLSLVALATRLGAARVLVALPVALHLFFFAGLVVLALRSDADLVDFVILRALPGFVVPSLGLLLTLLPARGRTASAAPGIGAPAAQAAPPFGSSS